MRGFLRAYLYYKIKAILALNIIGQSFDIQRHARPITLSELTDTTENYYFLIQPNNRYENRINQALQINSLGG
jgi:hypothetical protein